MKSLWNIMLGCLLVTAVKAQDRFALYTKREGLSDNNVKRMLHHSQGYLWIGTDNGLNRFDGYSFKVYKHSARDTNSISGNIITFLYEDKKARLWVGAYSKGINCFDPRTERFTKYLHDDHNKGSIGINNVMCMLEDSKGRLWFGIGGEGLALLDEATQTFRHFKAGIAEGAYLQRLTNTIHTIVEDDAGNLWLASKYGLHWFDTKKHTFKTCFLEQKLMGKRAANLFLDIHKNKDGSLWLSTWAAGLYYFQPATGKFRNYVYSPLTPKTGTTNIVTRMLPKAGNELWISTLDSGLGTFNTASGHFNFLHYNDHPLNEANAIAFDRQGSLWIGVSNREHESGLYRYDYAEPYFRTYTAPPPGNHHNSYITCVFKPSAAGVYLLGFINSDGLVVCDTNFRQFELVRYPVKNTLLNVTRIVEDKSGNIWLNTNDGPLLFDIEKRQFKKACLRLPSGDTLSLVRDIAKDTQGDLWFCNSRGLYRFDGKDVRELKPQCKDPGIYPDLLDIYIDPKNNIWFVTALHGLARYNRQRNEIEYFISNPNDRTTLANNEILDIVMHPDGSYWVSVLGSGVAHMKLDEKGTPVFADFMFNDRIEDRVGHLSIDAAGRVWISDSRALSVFDPSSRSFVRLDQRKGLHKSFYNPQVFFPEQGKAVFGVNHQVQELDLRHLAEIKPAPDVVLNSFKVNGEEWKLDTNINFVKTVDLDYRQNSISFEAAALNFASSDLNSYAYMLEGVDKEWNYTGSNRFGSYANLSPGTYKLRVKAAGDDNLWTNSGLALSIVITPPFWQTWWFSVSVSLLLLVIMYSIYKYRIRHIREKERIKSEFSKKVAEIEMTALRAQMNPHFIFNCLNSINRYVLMSEQDIASEYLTRFARLMRMILDNSKQEFISLEEELQALSLYVEMESLRFDNRFSFHVHVPDNVDVYALRVPPLLVQPFVENAIWHGLMNKEGRGTINVTVEKTEGNLQVIIDDDGVGRAKAKEYKASQTIKRQSHGMQITTDRISILNKLNNVNATVEIIDKVDEAGNALGTTVKLALPMLRRQQLQTPAENMENI